MNVYGVIIAVALIVKFLVGLAAERLNLRSLKPDLPDELRGVYDPQRYAKSQDYTRAHARLGVLESALDLAVLFIFWFAGGFDRLDRLIRGLGLGDIGAGIFYIGVLFLAGMILSLPFSIYSTFVIEEKFGFNRTKPRTFVLDRLKGLGLAAVLGIPLLAAVLWFFQHAGSAAWLYCWLVSAVFTLVMQFIAPVWILPLFNKFTPLPDGELKESIARYAAKAGLAFKGIFVMDGSRRSSKSNAFFAGIGKNRRIALYDTLIERHGVPELIAILAHEIGHLKKGHIIRNMVLGIVHAGVLFYLLSLFLNNRELFDAFGMKDVSVYGSLVFFGLLYEPLSFALSILLNAFSRRHEREADAYAARTIENPETLVSALKTLSVENLANLTPHPFYVFLFYSHPPLLQRIESIRAVGAVAR